MNIEPLQYVDLEKALALQPEGWIIKPHLEYYLANSFCHPFKLMDHTQVIGIGTAIAHLDSAWLGHIIVHPDFRNRGLGRLITMHLIYFLEGKGYPQINLIATDLGAPVYQKLGFVTDTEYLFYKDLQAIPGYIPSKKILPYSEKYKEALLTLDREIYREERRDLLSPHLSSGFIYTEQDQLTGFYLPNCAEGLVAARNAEAGIELLKLRLQTKNNASFPENNHAAFAFMEDLGYHSFRKAKRMHLGSPRPVMFEGVFNRTGGNLG
jgi:GNAT superfamily N-acetyltransferase